MKKNIISHKSNEIGKLQVYKSMEAEIQAMKIIIKNVNKMIS